MENMHELLLHRHSIRKYTGEPIPPEDVKQILEAALMAPSSKRSMPWEFVLVEDKATLEELSFCKDMGAKPIAGGFSGGSSRCRSRKKRCLGRRLLMCRFAYAVAGGRSGTGQLLDTDTGPFRRRTETGGRICKRAVGHTGNIESIVHCYFRV